MFGDDLAVVSALSLAELQAWMLVSGAAIACHFDGEQRRWKARVARNRSALGFQAIAHAEHEDMLVAMTLACAHAVRGGILVAPEQAADPKDRIWN